MPTLAEPGALSAQSGKHTKPHHKKGPSKPKQVSSKDEYGQGIISRPASLVAKAAGALSNAPIIGPYAKATEIAASGVSKIAALFGYSRPVTVEPVHPYVPTVMGNMANTNIADSCVKLSVDMKQELTVDPKTVGLGDTDEMALQYIAGRESYLATFPWKVSDDQYRQLFGTIVTPTVWAEVNDEIHMPACCFAAQPFENWRGNMIYRFQVVASNYHKGRLLVVWDPKANTGTPEMNVAYSHVIDIAEMKDFSISVGWGTQYPWLACRPAGSVNKGWENSTATVVLPAAPQTNGFLRVFVLNDLTVPATDIDNDISVNVFVRAGPNIEFANPIDELYEDLILFPQSGLEPQAGTDQNVSDETTTENPSIPQMEPELEILPELMPTDGIADSTMGEAISSFRTMLKRYTLHRTIGFETRGARKLFMRSHYYPYYAGATPGAVDETDLLDPYNYCRVTLLNYLTPAFVGYRGGIRHKFCRNAQNDGTIGPTNSMLVAKRAPYLKSGNNYSRVESSASVYAVTNGQLNSANTYWLPSGNAGIHATNTGVNPNLEIEIPYNSNLRYFPAKKADWTSSNTFANCIELYLYSQMSSVNSGTAWHDFVAAGEDFSLFFFTGCPVMYRETRPNPL
jgi:hypothetical protein